MKVDEENYLAHYGIIRQSGRYPWGSGGNVEQRSRSFLDWIQNLRRKGLKDPEIARGQDMTTTELRALNSIAKNEVRAADIRMATKLKEKGWSNVAIADRMDRPESSVRAMLAPGNAEKTDILQTTSKMLKAQVDEKGFIDVGLGTEQHIGVSKQRLDTAIAMLKEEGYETHRVKVKTNLGNETDVRVLGPPGSTQKEIWQDPTKIKLITQISDDGGRSNYGLLPPMPVDPKRVGITYAEDGGSESDGLIYVRPGVKDISLDGSSYAQVRIQVGEDRYLKGMALYKDDLPDGVDLMFNTNKSDTGNKLDALKPLSEDPDNPFGAQIKRQVFDVDSDGNHVLTSAVNIVNEEGDWGSWSKNLSSQMLSKQSPKLVKEQLDMTYENRLKEFNDISKLNNPAVREKLLMEFSEGTDAAAVHLKAASLPNQTTSVLLPVKSMAPNEVYAPGMKSGDTVVLIRYPHGGTFEIPELRVNNNNPEAARMIGNKAKDAIGINKNVAERMSGADFDGDFVLVIPNRSGKVATQPALEGLKNFDPQSAYPKYDGMRVMANTQTEMGKISNLITDMTIRQASGDELARAVRHSMVVIDAEKHELNYKQSAIDNGIKDLKSKYQPRSPDGTGGAATLVSRAGAQATITKRIPRPYSEGGPIDKATGELKFVPTTKTNYKTGKPLTEKVERLSITDDAHDLSSGTPTERLYANHSNKLKTLANRARKEAVNTPPSKVVASSKKVYSQEVASLDSKLALAKKNAPLERQAQILKNNIVQAKRQANPNMDTPTRKKIEAQALETMRNRTGAKKTRIEITQPEWDAIQAGAISNSKLHQILDNADMDVVRELATPQTKTLMTSSKTSRAQSMLNAGYTRADVAAALGVSVSTLDRSM